MSTIRYDQFVEEFSLSALQQQFVADFDQGLNVCTEICDRYATDPQRVAWFTASNNSGCKKSMAVIPMLRGRMRL